MTAETMAREGEHSFVDRHRAEQARKALPLPAVLQGLSQTFKVLGDETRLKISLALARRELTAAGLASECGVEVTRLLARHECFHRAQAFERVASAPDHEGDAPCDIPTRGEIDILHARRRAH